MVFHIVLPTKVPKLANSILNTCIHGSLAWFSVSRNSALYVNWSGVYSSLIFVYAASYTELPRFYSVWKCGTRVYDPSLLLIWLLLWPNAYLVASLFAGLRISIVSSLLVNPAHGVTIFTSYQIQFVNPTTQESSSLSPKLYFEGFTIGLSLDQTTYCSKIYRHDKGSAIYFARIHSFADGRCSCARRTCCWKYWSWWRTPSTKACTPTRHASEEIFFWLRDNTSPPSKRLS